jgi:hypothetical protein
MIVATHVQTSFRAVRARLPPVNMHGMRNPCEMDCRSNKNDEIINRIEGKKGMTLLIILSKYIIY